MVRTDYFSFVIKLLSVIFFGLAPLGIHAQNIRHLSVDEGLPQSFVSGIVEDNKGFIWISTRNGLARYDGHTFKIFQNNPADVNTLASNIISGLKKGTGNSLWIQYETGEIDKFSLTSEKAQHIITSGIINTYKPDLLRRAWTVSADTTVWFKTRKGQLCLFDCRSPDKVDYKYDILGDGIEIYNVLEDKNGTLWVLGKHALYPYNSSTKKFDKAIFIPKEYRFSENIVENFCPFFERENGELMWTTANAVYFFNPKNAAYTFRKQLLPATAEHNVKWSITKGGEYFIIHNTIYSYSDTGGIQPLTKIELSGNRQAQAFLADRSGLMWVGGDAQGVYTLDRGIEFKSFEYHNDFITDLLKEEYSISIREFFGWEERNGVISPSYYVRSATHNKKNWIALNRTVAYFDRTLNKMVKLPILPGVYKKFTPIVGISCKADGAPIVIDKGNTLYAFNYENKEWQIVMPANFLKKDDGQNSTANDLYVDPERNTAWIATATDGLFIVSLKTKAVQHLTSENGTLPTNSLLGILPDKDTGDILWLGSTRGLLRFSKKEMQFRVFSVKEGLPDNVIYSILQDRDGKLWLGTNKGLVSFTTTNYKCRVFKRSHGLRNIEFNRFHQLQFADGRMAFGGSGSGVIFNPEDIKEDTYLPVTVFTEIKVNNEDIRSLKSDLPPLHAVNDLVLPYNENTMSFTYSALQFNQPGDINYRYRLLGYDKDWIAAGRKREAVYTKLPPGQYVFEVNASNTSGIWSDAVRQISIQIAPPWWKTWWAYTGYVLILLLIIAWIINFRVRREVEKNKIQLKIKEAEELRKLDTIRDRFFSNIAHEFRTPLSLILGPAEQLKEKKRADDAELLDVIRKNTSSLMNLTDQLLDMARLEAGVLKPQMVWGDVVPVISNIVKAFTEEAAVKQVELTLTVPPSAEFLFSINTLDRIFYNLLSNALKFTLPGDSIYIDVQKETKGLVLKIKDTGTGIPAEVLPKIFNRYYKGVEKNPDGTGIGLSLVQELVELHQGTITVESSTEEPSGTLFSILLPAVRQEEEPIAVSLPKPDGGERPLVLVVEDHVELANFVAGNLERYYDVHIAGNGKEALEFTKAEMPDIIVSDVSMQPMDGFEFCRAVKQDSTINHISVILLTAKADMESRLEGLSYGANDYVTKPFSVPELNLRIHNLLELQIKQRDYLRKAIMLPEAEKMDEVKEVVNTEGEEFLTTIYAILDGCLDDKDFNVDQLAAALYMSRSTLHRKVKTLFDVPASEIIKIYRLKKASELLKKGYTSSEVSYMTGFNTPSYFTKCFKEYFNITPAQYPVK